MLVALALGALPALAACSPPPEEPPADAAESPAEALEQQAAEVQEEVDEAMTAIRQYTYAEREQFGQWASDNLEEIENRIEEVNARVATTDIDTQHDWETLKADLEQQRATVAAKVEQAMDATEYTWQTLSNEAARSIARFQEQLAEAIENLPPATETS